MTRDPALMRADIAACLTFYTKIPLPYVVVEGRSFGEAQWAAPLAGLAVAITAALTFWLASVVGIPPLVAALLAIAASMLVTGGLHEDGLADMIDGFGGGRTPERRLEIMRDSRIGSYGAAALVLSIALRAAALAAIALPAHAFWALLAAHVASRALMPAFLHAVAPARRDGLAHGVGAVPREAALVALSIGAVSLLPLGISAAVAAGIVLVILFVGLRRACEARIGGQTGDVLGALQQLSEIALICLASAVFS